MRHRDPHACGGGHRGLKATKAFAPKRGEHLWSQRRGGHHRKAARPSVAQKRERPPHQCSGPSVAQMWRRPPPDCGRGPGSPEVPEALTPQRREHRWSQISRGARSKAAGGPDAAKAHDPLRRGTGGPQAGAAPATMRRRPPFVERRQGPLTQTGRALGGPKRAEAPAPKGRGS